MRAHEDYHSREFDTNLVLSLGERANFHLCRLHFDILIFGL